MTTNFSYIPDSAKAVFERSKTWVVQYKLYHILFWIIYHYFWAVVSVGDPLIVAEALLFSHSSVKFLSYIIFQAIAVYVNLYFLIPQFLEKGKFNTYIFLLIVTILSAATFIIPGYYLSASLSDKTFNELYGNVNFWHFFKTYTFPSTVTSMMLTMSIKLTKNWAQSKRRQQMMEREKLETELKFLKYQFNPHFLFNTINSIFFLIHKNPDLASDALAKFSDLLRYQLFECNDKQILLATEIAYLENFIQLEKLRQNKNLQVEFQMEFAEKQQYEIAPFILMTFVENAFKHVCKDTQSCNWIKISLCLNQNNLDFAVSNNQSEFTTKDVIAYGGIGLANVKRRLYLLYPEKHILDIKDGLKCFDVHLRLELSECMSKESILNIPLEA